MNAGAFSTDSAAHTGLLVDTNLLVLYVVGTVNRDRIETFKRTSRYTKSDYDLLVRVLGKFRSLHTVSHVLSEVSNLTDLSGQEKLQARHFLRETISILNEVAMPSIRATQDPFYQKLGLADAAISAVARENGCAVLTDDFDLYHLLSHHHLPVFNFSHIQAGDWDDRTHSPI